MTKQLCLVCLLAGAIGASAQNNTVAAGGVATGSGGSATYSIGQIDYTTATGAGGTITQGNQQPYEIYDAGLDNLSHSITANVWPNPTNSGVTLSVNGVNAGDCFYTLYDVQGKQLGQQYITAENTIINMSSFASGVYMLQIINKNDNSTKTFKIVKNN